MGPVTIGIDIGQKRDPTAVAVVESQLRSGIEHFLVRHLERLPLGTSYPNVAQRLTIIVGNLKQRIRQDTVDQAIAENYPVDRDALQAGERAARMEVYADATGVGQPIVDLLDRAGVPVIATYFTFGDKRTREGTTVRLGKGWLVSRLQSLAQSDRLHLPDTTEAAAMRDELLDYEIRVDPDGDAKFGAFRTGKHDDLVTALGLAVQLDQLGAGFQALPPETLSLLQAMYDGESAGTGRLMWRH